jgi:hypothetical protein
MCVCVFAKKTRNREERIFSKIFFGRRSHGHYSPSVRTTVGGGIGAWAERRGTTAGRTTRQCFEVALQAVDGSE